MTWSNPQILFYLLAWEPTIRATFELAKDIDNYANANTLRRGCVSENSKFKNNGFFNFNFCFCPFEYPTQLALS